MNNEEEAQVEAAEETEQETPEADLSETTDWEAEAKKARAIAQRLRTKLTKATEKKVEAPATDTKEAKKTGLDRLDRAILRVEKITAEKEIELVESIMKETGKDVEAVLGSKYFQAELKAFREEQATKDATPSGTKRSAQSARDEVDYWIAKGELPKDNPELARKVVNAKLEKIKSRNQFSDDPIG